MYFNCIFNFIYIPNTVKKYVYHKFYIKQMNLELEVVQPIYVQKKKKIFGHV